jgi:hypothetical protein
MSKRKKKPPSKPVIVSDDPEVQEALARFKLEYFTAVTGRSTYVDATNAVLKKLTDKFGAARTASALCAPLLAEDIRGEVHRRCIEKHDEDEQGDLFGEGFREATVKLDEKSFTKVRYANADVLTLMDTRKGANFERQVRAHARWKLRMHVLFEECGMKNDPELTVEMALQRWRPSAARGGGDEARPSL